MPQRIAALPEDQRLPILIWEAAGDYMYADPLIGERSVRRYLATSGPGTDRREPEGCTRGVAAIEDVRAGRPGPREEPFRIIRINPTRCSPGTWLWAQVRSEKATERPLSAPCCPPQTLARHRMVASRSKLLRDGSLERRLIGPLLPVTANGRPWFGYFERSAEKRPRDRERLLAAAMAIRNGKLPSNYERR